MLEGDTIVRNYLDNQRNVLVTAGDTGPLERDLELHLLSIDVVHDPATLRLLKDGLSTLALYQSSRPRFESYGWTVSLRDPSRNLFFAGSAAERSVVGRAFLENVQPSPKNLFFSQTARPHIGVQTSSVEVEGTDILRMVEEYALRSDQQPIRFFRGEGGPMILFTSLPETDRAWLAALGEREAREILASGQLKLTAELRVSFHCGCDLAVITRMLVDLFAQDDPAALFQGESELEVECPRCATKHRVERERFEARRAERGSAAASAERPPEGDDRQEKGGHPDPRAPQVGG